ncbi:hypothetical protein IIU_05749 [Bacillus cereus VD133]|uniref:Uncharacterized protein n=1 Tax=Bacillus cereus VD133 TaxID=1053233 RepID=A0A9W5UZY8_BACCE|nr:hypothetical protein [Bacillus cereus]EOO28631.1 hypothetical protein IIU_05749 [Bacillus cereus VD133]
MGKVLYECLKCSNRRTLEVKKGKYLEVTVCSRCQGAAVDVAHRAKYKQMNQINPDNLLSIHLSDIDAVPDVYYKGEQITGRVRVSFDWKTSSFDHKNNTYIHLEFFDDESERCNSKMIQHNHPLKERKFINEERG